MTDVEVPFPTEFSKKIGEKEEAVFELTDYILGRVRDFNLDVIFTDDKGREDMMKILDNVHASLYNTAIDVERLAYRLRFKVTLPDED